MTLPALDPVASHALAAALATVLLLGAWAKLRDVPLWREMLANYELLPAPLLAPLAWALPLAEGLAGTLLLPSATRAAGAAAAGALVAVVTLAAVLALARGRAGIDCGCAGAEHEVPLSPALVLRNLVLLALLAAAALPIAARVTVWLDVAAMAGAALFLLGAWTLANTLLAQHPRLQDLRNAP